MAELKKLETAAQNETAEVNKPTYEQLKDWCDQLLAQRNQLAQRLNQVTNVTNKLPWLFEVLKSGEFFSDNFVKKCAEEIEYIMTPPEEEKPEDGSKQESKD